MKTNSKVVSIYVLKQVKNLSKHLMGEYIARGYTLGEFVEVESTVSDRAIPHENFAKTVYKNLINQIITNNNINIRAVKDNFDSLLFEHGDWIETLSDNGNKAYDNEIHIIAVENLIKSEVCTEYIRVEVRDITSEQESTNNNEIHPGDKLSIVKFFITNHPELSNRAIGRECGIPRNIVSRYRKDLEVEKYTNR